MPTAFPAIKPTSRSFTAPMIPTSTLRSQSGVVTRRIWNHRPSNAKLELRFNNINDTLANSIIEAHYLAMSSFDSLTLPDTIFGGATGPLRTWLSSTRTGPGLLWYFTEGSAPRVETVTSGRHNVSVSLTAELRMS